MIESWMFFALGFLAAALFGILIVPAINARAERLARRRAEAMLPRSLTELNAEKDHLRAELAVEQRRIERKAEAALAARHADMEELGRRALRITALEEEVAARDATIASRDAAVAALEADLAAARASLAETEAALGERTKSLRGVEEILPGLRSDLAAARTALAEAEAEVARRGTALEAAQGTAAALQSARASLLAEVDALRAALAEAERESAELRREITALRAQPPAMPATPESDGAVSVIRAENAALLKRIDAVADEILRLHEGDRKTPAA